MQLFVSCRSKQVRTWLEFKPLTRLTKDQITKYIASGEAFGKAGAYGIQGLGSVLIESITGSYSGIMGLPLAETSQLLNLAQVVCPLSTTHE